MEKEKDYKDLTNKQRWALQALQVALAKMPTPETIAECIRLRWWGKANTDEAKADFRRAYSSARAVQLVMSYLRYLENLDDRRVQLGDSIQQRLDHPEPESREKIPTWALADIEAMELACVSEILMTDFANTCIQLYGLLKKATEGADYEVPPADLKYLDHYRPLRDYYARIYNRLPGGSNQGEIVTEIDDDRGFQIIIGFEIDDQQRVIWGDKRIEVNTAGMQKVSEIVRRNLRAFGPSARTSLHNYFVQHPENIPPLSAINRRGLGRAARIDERGSRARAAEPDN